MTSSPLEDPALRCAATSVAVRPTREQTDRPGATVLDVVGVTTAAGVEIIDALAVAGALEAESTHPIGIAIAAHAAQQARFWPAMTAISRIDELGVTGDTGAREALIGSPALVAAHGITLPAELTTAVVGAAIDARTPVVLAWNGRARAVLVVGETPRPEPARPGPPRPAAHRHLIWTVIAVLATVAMAVGRRRFR